MVFGCFGSRNKFICFVFALIATLRSPKKRSLLGVNEYFEGKRNAEITLLDNFLYYCLSISFRAKAYAPSDIAVLAPIFENITPIRFCGSYVTSLSVP